MSLHQNSNGDSSRAQQDSSEKAKPVSLKIKIHIYLENSGSMDGYVVGNTDFKDILGRAQYVDANGNISVGSIINLHSVTIGGVTLSNVKANVVENINAPLLLGQTALKKFGKISIDYDEKIIEFN